MVNLLFFYVLLSRKIESINNVNSDQRIYWQCEFWSKVCNGNVISDYLESENYFDNYFILSTHW